MSELTVHARGPLRGAITIPGDKSISHRSLMLNALASGPATIRGLLMGEDVLSTAALVRALGAEVVFEDDGTVRITPPEGGLREPVDVVDCGNSGTTIRLASGLLAAEPMHVVLTGDDSLRSRPMARVANPLRGLGAQVDGRQGGRLAPLSIRGGSIEAETRHDLQIASAQVKSCLLLAGRKVGISVREPRQSRDHTERMLRKMGAALTQDAEGWLHLAPVEQLRPIDVEVPGDCSSAAFWMVAASIIEGSEVTLRRVGMNPTRTGAIDALKQMGANLEIRPYKQVGPEPMADIVVRSAQLKAARIDGELALRSLDELPVLAVAAAFAVGTTVIADAEELRVKESDRIARVAAGLKRMGVQVTEQPDGMTIEGGRPAGPATVDARGDHRIAMAFAVAALASEGGVTIEAAESIGTSYPTFFEHLDALSR